MVLRRLVHGLLAAILIVTATPRPGHSGATAVDKAAKVLATSDDYRLRLGAALTLGNSGDFKARKPLEEALDDPHPSVRQAAATALAKLGDVLAVSALESRAKKEPNAPTKVSMQKAIAELKASSSSGGGSGGGGSTGAAPDWKSTKYVVKLQKVSNGTGVRGEALATVLRQSAMAKFGGVSGVLVLDETASSALLVTAQQKGLPVLGGDASLSSLDQGTFAGDLKIQAKVSFAITKLQVVKASIEGNASTIGSTSAQKNPASLAKLQDMAVDGAVISAMSKAPSALKAAAGL
ncbi:MAG: hypothetical protein NVS3B10_08080 [Polyangiales bacterium]